MLPQAVHRIRNEPLLGAHRYIEVALWQGPLRVLPELHRTDTDEMHHPILIRRA